MSRHGALVARAIIIMRIAGKNLYWAAILKYFYGGLEISADSHVADNLILSAIVYTTNQLAHNDVSTCKLTELTQSSLK